MTKHQEAMNANRTTLIRKTNELQQKQNTVVLVKRKIQSLKQSIGEKENIEKAKLRVIANEENLLEASRENVQELTEEIAAKRDILESKNQQYVSNNAELSRITDNIHDLQEEKNTCEQEK
ncbi:unnamed protein product [Didymodactylos carnosus]|nr:unnamed protein product [Didymodactylos carnosus]CAF4366966.1 unnamed protein product [Didymodactylos carnosus]